MYIRVSNKNIELDECNSFLKRFKSLKFYLYPLEKGLFFPNRKFLNTYFFCQNVDALFVDDDFNIIKIYHNLKTEKRYVCFNAKHLFILPANSCIYLDVGDRVSIK